MNPQIGVKVSALIDKFLLGIDLAMSKVLRPALKDSINSKRINQAFFRSLVGEVNKVLGQEVAQYVQTDRLRDYLSGNRFPNSTTIVLIGGADIDITCADLKDLSTYQHITFFIQHLDCKESENIKMLPIGVEDLKRARNGLPWNFSKGLRRRKKISRVLVGPFKITDPSRRKLHEIAVNHAHATVKQRRLASFVYSRIAAKHQFIACPRGAGIDTHRFWESLYRGSIPIVIDSDWARNFDEYFIPLVRLTDWNALETIDLDFYKNFPKRESLYLCPEWWRERLVTLAQEKVLSK